MSAPSNYIRESEQIKYSFLAVKSKAVLDKALHNSELLDEDFETLKKANAFLKDIVEGAQLVSTGDYHGHNSLESMEALEFAMDPLNRLENIIQNEEIVDFFRDISINFPTDRESIVHEVENDREHIVAASSFFGALYESLRAAMAEKNEMTTSNILNGFNQSIYG